jgi:hypothetical protein
VALLVVARGGPFRLGKSGTSVRKTDGEDGMGENTHVLCGTAAGPWFRGYECMNATWNSSQVAAIVVFILLPPLAWWAGIDSDADAVYLSSGGGGSLSSSTWGCGQDGWLVGGREIVCVSCRGRFCWGWRGVLDDDNLANVSVYVELLYFAVVDCDLLIETFALSGGGLHCVCVYTVERWTWIMGEQRW